MTSKRTVFAIAHRGGHRLLPPCSAACTAPNRTAAWTTRRDLIAAVLQTEALDPSNTIMVGDRMHDIIGAQANSLRSIGVLWGYGSRTELEQAGADALARHPSELPRLTA